MCRTAKVPFVMPPSLSSADSRGSSKRVLTGGTSPLARAWKYLWRVGKRCGILINAHPTRPFPAHCRIYTYAADHCSRSAGCVRIAALVNSFRISGSSAGILICSAQYRGPSLLCSIAVATGSVNLFSHVTSRFIMWHALGGHGSGSMETNDLWLNQTLGTFLLSVLGFQRW